MQEFIIRLGSVPDVENFVSISTSRDFRIQVSDGNQVVNGKSFMQMFCLDLSRHLSVTAECGEDQFSRLHEEINASLNH